MKLLSIERGHCLFLLRLSVVLLGESQVSQELRVHLQRYKKIE